MPTLGQVAGPLLGGATDAFLGGWAALGLDAVSFLVSADPGGRAVCRGAGPRSTSLQPSGPGWSWPLGRRLRPRCWWMGGGAVAAGALLTAAAVAGLWAAPAFRRYQ